MGTAGLSPHHDIRVPGPFPKRSAARAGSRAAHRVYLNPHGTNAPVFGGPGSAGYIIGRRKPFCTTAAV